MENDYGKMSREALARIDKVSDRVIFWALVFAAVVVSSVMLKGMLW